MHYRYNRFKFNVIWIQKKYWCWHKACHWNWMRSKYFWWVHRVHTYIENGYKSILDYYKCNCGAVNGRFGVCVSMYRVSVWVIEFWTQQENYSATENGIFNRISSSRKYNLLLLRCTLHTHAQSEHERCTWRPLINEAWNMIVIYWQRCISCACVSLWETRNETNPGAQEARCRQFTVIPFKIYIQF